METLRPTFPEQNCHLSSHLHPDGGHLYTHFWMVICHFFLTLRPRHYDKHVYLCDQGFVQTFLRSLPQGNPGPSTISFKEFSEPFLYAYGRIWVYLQIHHLAFLLIKAWLPFASILRDLKANTIRCHRKTSKFPLYLSIATLNIKKRTWFLNNLIWNI